MVQVLLVILMFLSFTFVFLQHPVSMGLVLIVHALLIGVTAGVLSGSMWYSYVLFLVFLGGVLVLYIYMTSLASNEKFDTNFILVLFIIGGGVASAGLMALVLPSFELGSAYQDNSPITPGVGQAWATMSKLYNTHSYLLTSFLIVYLLFVLLVCAEVAATHRGALRGFN